MKEQKLCENCKHFVPDLVNWKTPGMQVRYAICSKTSKVSKIDGTECAIERDYSFIWISHCGSSARFYEESK